MTSTTVHLVRHGETIWHAENRYAGRSNVSLTDLGRQQAVQLARWAVTAQPDRVISSPLSRAVATATPAALALGRPVQIEPDLREVDFGRGEGMTRTEMASVFSADLARFHDRPATCSLPDGERGIDAIERANAVIDRLSTGHDGETILVVAHSTLLRLVICDRIGIDPDEYRRVLPRLDNVALTTLRLQNGRAQLLGLNIPLH